MLQNLVSIILFLSVAWNAYSSEFMPDRSSYSFRTNILDCNNLEPLKGCRHEIGHKMDDDLGMPSQTEEFVMAMQVYVAYELNSGRVPSDMAMLIHLYPERSSVELYASIYARVDGDISQIPESLRVFYSDDPSYLELYECLAKPGLNVCGRSISYLTSQQ